MIDILTCEDRWGRIIVLRDDIWYEKILPDHYELVDDVRIIEQVIADPDRINVDALHVNGENYYRRGMLRNTLQHRFLKVVVRFEQVDHGTIGTIVSAYGVPDYRKAGEKRKWGVRGN